MNNDELPLSFEFDKYVNLNSFVDTPPPSGGGSDDVNPSLKDHLRYEHPLVQRYVNILIIAAATTTSITMVLDDDDDYEDDVAIAAAADC